MSFAMRWYDGRTNFAAHPVAWPLVRIARRIAPVFAVPGLGVIVSDAEVAHDVLVQDHLFLKNGEGSFSSIITELLGPFALGNMDGEAHANLRARLARVVAPANAGNLLRGCTLPLSELCAALERGESVDLVEAMHWMSGRITFDMLGVTPPGDERAACVALVRLGERIARGFDFRRPSGRRLAAAHADAEQLASYARHGYDSPDAPEQSFVRQLRDSGLSFEEARGVITLIFMAGTLTTAAAVPRILALLLDSGQFGALRTDSSAVMTAVAEGLRYTTPVPATMRIAQRATTIDGRHIEAGTRMLLLTCNMARDPRMFDDADRFHPLRRQPPRSRTLWYGAGPHFCLGFHIAQRQLQLVFDALRALDGELTIVRRRFARRVVVAAYSQMLLRLDAPAARTAR